jgi:dTDP-4-dehydrorhamnose reductase
MSRRILVVGASGLLGGHIAACARDAGHKVLGTYRSLPTESCIYLDVEEPTTYGEAMRFVPEIIIVPAGNANVDQCEHDPVRSFACNVDATARFVFMSKSETDCRVIFFSSDYVFDGAAGPYTETAEPSPLQAYGRQKLEMERIFSRHYPNDLVVRATVLFGYEHHGKNFAYRVLENARSGRITAVPTDQIGTPTYAPNLARALLAEHVLENMSGIVHFAGPERLSRYDFAVRILNAFGFDSALAQGTVTEVSPVRAPRPRSAGLISGRCDLAALGFEPLQRSLEEFRQAMSGRSRPLSLKETEAVVPE